MGDLWETRSSVALVGTRYTAQADPELYLSLTLKMCDAMPGFGSVGDLRFLQMRDSHFLVKYK